MEHELICDKCHKVIARAKQGKPKVRVRLAFKIVGKAHDLLKHGKTRY